MPGVRFPHVTLPFSPSGGTLCPCSFNTPGLGWGGGCQHRNMAASTTAKAKGRQNSKSGDVKRCEESMSQCREIIKPTIIELTKEVRTNILCTVEGCGKILPNTPALNMHLVKSHRINDGIVNPTVRKEIKGSQKLYCCPVEGCPRGPNRPFSQFSLVKQHYMKMHAEKKHKCSKCNNGYSTEWDLKRHVEDCGKTYQCTCGCPYASRAALLSHIYRTGHEIPSEHRVPPVKKRKMEKLLNVSEKVEVCDSTAQKTPDTKEVAEMALPADSAVYILDPVSQNCNPHRGLQKLLLPKPKMTLVSVPIMQLAHLPVLLPSTESGALRSVVLAVDNQGSVGTLQLLPQTPGTVLSQLDVKSFALKDCLPSSRSSQDPISTGVQVNLDPTNKDDSASSMTGQRGRGVSTNIQTDRSYLSKMAPVAGIGEGIGLCSVSESSVSSCSQTDISVSAQVLLPVSVETQTFVSRAKPTSSVGAQTDSQCFSQIASSCSSVLPYKTKQTQTCFIMPQLEEKAQNQAVMCSDLFENDSLSVSTQTCTEINETLNAEGGCLYADPKSVVGMCFGVQTHDLNASNVADNQTQTITLLNDLENILSGHQDLAEASAGCGSGPGSVPEQHNGIDFDFEEFLNAVHIQTQTEESELGVLGGDTPLESLDIQTQTDFLLMDELDQSEGQNRSQASDLELFDTQTQTDLNFLLSSGSSIPLSNILRHSSFSISTESSDTETQTDPPSFAAGLSSQTQTAPGEHGRMLNSTETQTVTSQAESLGHLFLTSNETQTVMDDFLSADLAWNMESHFSSVETQTCEELCALFQHSDKPNS
ncbi:ATM interactor [Cyprinodon tularosa]|uniref:ATM interactor n=1 Tax=Cyprinodon tularosa TaxID=77115 RepID=UPI0018E1DB9B|nr:ATM interactor [Cyprinodon tularosa]